MALISKLVMRQSQSLVMTPQLLQAIKLLQFSNLELIAFVEQELERNPLLERAEDAPDPENHVGDAASSGDMDQGEFFGGEDFNERSETEWSSEASERVNDFETAGV